MGLYFDHLKLLKEEAEEEANKENCETVESPKRDHDEVDDDGFILVTHKRPRKSALKVKTGQL
jgi:hypothetical protein